MRRYPTGDSILPLEPGDYAKHPENGDWYAMTPNGHLAGLRLHTVTEHDDGTITVDPSILVSTSDGPVYHGWLRAGVWSDA